MTGNETQPAELNTDESSRDSSTHSRRRLLQHLTAGGALLLAGCGQGESESSTAGRGATSTTDSSSDHLPHVNGQTFRAPTGNDPEKTTFYSRNTLGRHLQTTFATVVKENAANALQRFVWETGLWSDGLFGTGDVHYTWIDDPIEVTPTEVTITVTDDAQWSDGHPITGRDLAVIPLHQAIRKSQDSPFYATDEQNEPANIYAAFDDFELTERSVTYRSSPGYFDQFWDWFLRTRLGTWYGPHLLPTHLEPYEAYTDEVIETVRSAQRGEIEPWKEDSNDPDKASLIQKHLAKRKYVEKFSKAENVLATGAWDLVDMSGKEFVFEKNTHHRNADAINYDKVVFEYTPSSSRMHAALRADRMDYASTTYSPVTPQSVVQSFPDSVEQLLIPGGLYTGNELSMNFDHPQLGKRDVRAAIMYALDHELIANNIHPEAAEPVTNPGGDCWNATGWASQDWIAENLSTYDTDQERAASLMREAGFTRDGTGGPWLDGDGDPITLTIATPTSQNSSPIWEPTVASQLSQFGLETSVATLSPIPFADRVSNGEFPLWNSGVTTSLTNLPPATLFIWLFAVMNPQKYRIFPKEQFSTSSGSGMEAPKPRTKERWNVFTVEAPPVGKPDAPLEKYHPASSVLSIYTNPPIEEFRQQVRTGMWLGNWFLPTIPITRKLEQHFIDASHWLWPTDTASWKNFTGGGPRMSSGILASGEIQANPDAPEEG